MPSVPGKHEFSLPFGIYVSYLSLDYIVNGSAGVFVIRGILNESDNLTLNFGETWNLSRKERKRIGKIVANAERWRNPKTADIDSLFDHISQSVVREFDNHAEDAFSNAVTTYKDFVSSFSHEALSPIQEIRTSLELIVSKATLETDVRERLQSSLRALDSLRVSLEGMRLLFRDDEKRPLSNQFRSTDIRPIVRQWCDVYRSQFSKKNIEVILESTAQQWFIWCVPEYIEVMVRNLVSNGLKYSFDASGYETPGKFLVRFVPAINQLSIVNFGVPIAADEIESGRLFSQGVRGNTANDRGRMGKGVGLFLVHRVVTMHNAECMVESDVQNPGSSNEFARTEFKIRFPKGGRRLR